MFYDDQGKPDPNGDFQMIDGKMIVRDGRGVRFSIMMRDSAARIGDGAAMLRDSAGQPVRLFDDQQREIPLNEALIAAIESEAQKLGLSVGRYLGEVVHYHTAKSNLSQSAGA
jgi:hypothetical protein